jgi:hypothetical protein
MGKFLLIFKKKIGGTIFTRSAIFTQFTLHLMFITNVKPKNLTRISKDYCRDFWNFTEENEEQKVAEFSTTIRNFVEISGIFKKFEKF